MTSALIYLFKFSSDENVSIPLVSVVLEGGPGTLETVKSAIKNGTPAVIVEVGLCFMDTLTVNAIYTRSSPFYGLSQAVVSLCTKLFPHSHSQKLVIICYMFKIYLFIN